MILDCASKVCKTVSYRNPNMKSDHETCALFGREGDPILQIKLDHPKREASSCRAGIPEINGDIVNINIVMCSFGL